MSRFHDVEPKPDFPALERRILEFWKESRAFEKRVEMNRGKEPFRFMDGPITANNPMGVHHAWGRTYKDVFQRHRAMLGYDGRYQNGFDCQGLWVEVEVEKDLGLNSKRDIVSYGLDKFAVACKERIRKYSAIQTEQSRRLGQWMHWDDSYYTYTDANIEAIWHFLKKCDEKGWLYKGHRSMPWCVRCGTSLSQHELIDSYKDIAHTAVFVKFPIVSRPKENFLVWTTTPWTLLANVGAAIHPELTYALVKPEGSEDLLWLSKGTLNAVQGKKEIVSEAKGETLLGLEYRTPFEDLPAQKGVVHKSIPWDMVGETEGTGIVHIAPGCGAEDFELGKKLGLALIAPIDEEGRYFEGFGAYSGKAIGGLAEEISADLKARGRLQRKEKYTHRYPCCWRCKEELAFRIVDEWFIACGEIRESMIREARKVNWMPDYMLKRMEDWLLNMGDWCISRKRFWGLPLPIYVDPDGERTVVGSRAELAKLAVKGDVAALPELHRPWIDEIEIRSPKSGKTAKRVVEVGDCWLDAGIVPFSTLRYFDDNAYWERWFPSDFICEMREQIRLWFYAQLFMSVTLENRAPYLNVLVYEKVQDQAGKDMHKSLGNAIWFDDAVEKMGADVMRWMYSGQNVQTNLRFGYGPADEVRAKLLTLWNVYSFFVLYANLDGADPAGKPLAQHALSTLDRWILARLQSLVATANESLLRYDAAAVVKEAEGFFDDLSNWYLRRSRKRFWREEKDADKAAAYATLYHVLLTACRALAPVIPFFTEELYRNLKAALPAGAPESIHHFDYPKPDPAFADRALVEETASVLRVVNLGHSARNAANIKVRQPIARVFVKARHAAEKASIEKEKDTILDELNAKAIEYVDDVTKLVEISVKPNLKTLGPKHGKLLNDIRKALTALDPVATASTVREGKRLSLAVAGETLDLAPEDVLVDEKRREGQECAAERGTVVGIDTALTEALLDEGLARDFVRNVQSLRKDAGFKVSDRIAIAHGSADPRLVRAIERFREHVMRETLADELSAGGSGSADVEKSCEVGDITCTISLRRRR